MLQEPAGNTSPVNPLSMSLEEMARMLSAVGEQKVTADMVAEDLTAGAPSIDGRINLLNYTAWLMREVRVK